MSSWSDDGLGRGGHRPSALGLAPTLEAHGLNVAGVLTASRYDRAVSPPWRTAALSPGARHAIVLGAGGRDFFRAFARSPEAADGRRHPVDDFTARVTAEAFDGSHGSPEGAAFYYWQRHEGRFVDIVELGRIAGLGAPGRLGLLLHPVFGPWLSIRALVLTTARIVAPPPSALAPGAYCTGCPAPCEPACPGGALPSDGFDAPACLATRRRRSDCAVRCAARHACVIGQAYAYDPDAEEFLGRAALRDPTSVK